MSDVVIYQGRPISTHGFRVFIYGPMNQQKIVNSWKDYQAHIATGLWFSKKEDVKEEIGEVKAITKGRPRKARE